MKHRILLILLLLFTNTGLISTFMFLSSDESPCSLYKCGCSNDSIVSKTIDCSYFNLTNISNINVPGNTLTLNLKGNNLEALPATFCKSAENVILLDLSYNSLGFIAGSAFKSFSALSTLILSHNKLWSLNQEVFAGLEKLHILDLSYNQLQTFFEKDFLFLENLQELSFERNPLSFLRKEYFTHLKNLKTLNVASTGLAVLPDDVFASVQGLKVVKLSGNGFETIAAVALSNMTSLSSLDLSQNAFRKIPPYCLHNMKSLQVLYLNDLYELNEIGPYAFGELSSLKECHLNYNPKLKKIHADAFRRNASGNLIVLEQLHLRQTGLESLSRDLQPWVNLSFIDLSENPWNCDCHIEWMLEVKFHEIVEYKMRCNKPEKLKGYAIFVLEKDDLVCFSEKRRNMIINGILLAASILVIIITGFAFYICRKKKMAWKYSKVLTYKQLMPPAQDDE